MKLETLIVGDPQIVRDLADHNDTKVIETDDGWLNTNVDGTVYKAAGEAA